MAINIKGNIEWHIKLCPFINNTLSLGSMKICKIYEFVTNVN